MKKKKNLGQTHDAHVIESAKALLDAGEVIPCDLTAKVLKFMLLQIKADDQQRRITEQLELGSLIFDSMARLIYQCLEWHKQHQYYLSCTNQAPKMVRHFYTLDYLFLLCLYFANKGLDDCIFLLTLTSLPLFTDADMRYYSNLLDLVPPEACSVPLILDCMLQQAVKGFDPAEVERSMMELSPVWELIQSVAYQENNSCHWLAVKQQLQHFCTDDTLSWTNLERLFHQSVFEAMPLTRLDEKGELLPAAGKLGIVEPASVPIIPWDNPVAYALQQLHKQQNKGLLIWYDNCDGEPGRFCGFCPKEGWICKCGTRRWNKNYLCLSGKTEKTRWPNLSNFGFHKITVD
uniref:Uncharacterized protein n=1 Tax=Cynoglossus semilaevis TaxID=244447 RepID=A0A3P8VQX7_CYNSE